MFGENVYAIELDVSSGKSVSASLSEVLKVFKTSPSIVVNAAGIARDNFIFHMTEEEFDDVIQVNLKVRKQSTSIPHTIQVNSRNINFYYIFLINS